MSEAAPPPRPGPQPAVVPEEQRVEPDLVATMEELVDGLARRPDPDVAHRLEWLIDMLVLRGHLGPGHRRMIHRIKADAGSRRVRLATYPDKRAVVGADIDCASRMHLCQGRCCAMDVSLSREDLEEGRLRWDLHEPYVLAKNPDTGYCGCLDQAGACTVYADRPGTCRAYDCRSDPRVWIDFEQRVATPLPARLVPLVPPRPAQPDDGGDAGPTTSAG
jgi:Fe-S-cluster containining protein